VKKIAKRLTYEYVKREIASVGYNMVSKTYKNAITDLEIDCNNGHIFTMKWNNFKSGHRCYYCSGSRIYDHKDIVGERFGKLIVVEYIGFEWDEKCEQKYKKYNYYCQCDCGNKKVAIRHHLKCGNTRSCGCLKYEVVNKGNTRHGLKDEKLYGVWNSIKNRCYNPHVEAYHNYGGRGVEVCDKWKNDFLSFYNWAMSNGYKKGLSIDRINNDGNYEPVNCRWVDSQTQNENTRQCVKVRAINNITGEIKEFPTKAKCSKELGIGIIIVTRSIEGKNTRQKEWKFYRI